MSYGFYKMSPGSSHEDYIARVAGDTPIAIGIKLDSVSRDIGHISDHQKPLEPPRVNDTLISDTRSKAKTLGYTGNVCTHCHGTRMKMAGHCEVCEDCGESSGCS